MDGLDRFRHDNPDKRITHVRELGEGHCGRLVLARACGLAGEQGCRRICDVILTQLLANQPFLSNWATPARVAATINTVKAIRNYEKCPATQWINEIQWKAAAIALQRHIIIIPKNANGPTIISPHVRLSLKEYDDCSKHPKRTWTERPCINAGSDGRSSTPRPLSCTMWATTTIRC